MGEKEKKELSKKEVLKERKKNMVKDRVCEGGTQLLRTSLHHQVVWRYSFACAQR